MANDHVKMFIEEYTPIAIQVSKKTGIAPSVLLAQWGMETGYGRSVPGHFNLGNIKDNYGGGTEAIDNKTGSKDKYINFESPEAFGDYYANMMRRIYPEVINVGSDITKYAQGLKNGVYGSYADKNTDYESAIRGAYNVTTQFYTDPEKLPTARPLTQAEQITQEKESQPVTPPTTGQPKEVIDPTNAMIAGAVGLPLGQIPFEAEMPARAPDINASQKAVEDARIQYNVALDRLKSRNDPSAPLYGRKDISSLENDFAVSQSNLETAQRELDDAVAAQKASKVTAPKTTASTTTPSSTAADTSNPLIVDPNAPRTSQERILQGNIDTETGNTGRQNMVFNEVTSYQKLEREANERALAEARKKGLVADTGETPRIKFGAPTAATPSGIVLSGDVGKQVKMEQELNQNLADEQAQSQSLEDQRRMNELRYRQAEAERAHSQAQSELQKTQNARLSGINRAQTAFEGRADAHKIAEAQLEADRLLAQKAPSMLQRPLEVTGVKTSKANPLIKGGLGALAGYQGATAVNRLANMPVQQLLLRFKQGDRSPEVINALMGAGIDLTQAASGAAVMVPAMGPRTARVKGAGAIGTALGGLYNAYQAVNEEANKAP